VVVIMISVDGKMGAEPEKDISKVFGHWGPNRNFILKNCHTGNSTEY
jgi:hypothetical protein